MEPTFYRGFRRHSQALTMLSLIPLPRHLLFPGFAATVLNDLKLHPQNKHLEQPNAEALPTSCLLRSGRHHRPNSSLSLLRRSQPFYENALLQ